MAPKRNDKDKDKEDGQHNSNNKEDKKSKKRKEKLDKKENPKSPTPKRVKVSSKSKDGSSTRRNLELEFEKDKDIRVVERKEKEIERNDTSSDDDFNNNATPAERTRREETVTTPVNSQNSKRKRQKFVNERQDLGNSILDFEHNSSDEFNMDIETQVVSVANENDKAGSDESEERSSSSDESITTQDTNQQTNNTEKRNDTEISENNPLIQDLVSRLVAKELKNRLGDDKVGNKLVNKIEIENKIRGGKQTTDKPTPKAIKSNSVITTYSPALMLKKPDADPNAILQRFSPNQSGRDKGDGDIARQNQSIKQIEQSISNYLGKVRSESSTVEKPGRSDDPNFSMEPDPKSKRMAEQAVINAEKFKATIATGPAGKNILAPPVDLNFDDSRDGEFSDADCHVDLKSTQTIARGGFLEVEKLIPKQRVSKPDEGRMEFVHRDGQTFLVPQSERDLQKVTNVRKWEQGFKVYASVYSKFNPHRAAEIWQYIHTINLAASSYTWDNVAYYDFTFRQQMDKYPQRSWAKINNQLWSLAMRDPLSFRSQNGYNSSNTSHLSNSSNKKLTNNFGDNVCWRFNKDKCNRSASACRFEHKCSYCGGYSHGAQKCNKKRGRSNEENNSNKGSKKPTDRNTDTKN